MITSDGSGFPRSSVEIQIHLIQLVHRVIGKRHTAIRRLTDLQGGPVWRWRRAYLNWYARSEQRRKTADCPYPKGAGLKRVCLRRGAFSEGNNSQLVALTLCR